MSWNHVVLEGFCFYENEEFIDVPCCNTKPGFVSIECLCDTNNQKCPFFGYTKARTCIVLTDDKGHDVACNTFWVDEPDNSKYIIEENEWIATWKKLIERSKESRLPIDTKTDD